MARGTLLSRAATPWPCQSTVVAMALQEISRRVAEVTGENERDIFNVIIEREKLGTTGVGDGIAIPHGKLETLQKLYENHVKKIAGPLAQGRVS